MRKQTVLTVAFMFAVAVLAVRAEETAPAPDAQTTYATKCAPCHGKEGKGDTKLGQKVEVKDLTDAKYQTAFTDDKAFKDIKEGLKDGETVKMKAFGDKLSDAQIKALVDYVRALAKKAEPKAEPQAEPKAEGAK